MALAFVLVNSEARAERKVLTALKSIDVVKETHVVYGVYDIIVKVEAPSLDTLKDTIIAQIRQLENVRSTLTLIAVENKTGVS